MNMPRFVKVDAQVMEKPVKRATPGRAISPEQQALVRRIRGITDESIAYEARLDKDEKPATVRQQILRAAKLAGVEVAVRKSPSGFYFGLMTPARRSNRGRKRTDGA
jgi:hypothetical protein